MDVRESQGPSRTLRDETPSVPAVLQRSFRLRVDFAAAKPRPSAGTLIVTGIVAPADRVILGLAIVTGREISRRPSWNSARRVALPVI
jgi:hypothetical protein